MLARTLIRKFSTSPVKAVLPDLAYDYSELSPVLDASILEVHHGKHHQNYVNAYNTLIPQLQEAAEQGDANRVAVLSNAVKFNAGGHINHSIYWSNLASKNKAGGDLPAANSELSKLINSTFGGYEPFIKSFNTKTAAVQGSGWGWLAYHKATGNLSIMETSNQVILTELGHTPLLVIDVWEHAYYLQYKNLRPKYLEAIWEVVNWKDVERRFKEASA
jgi:Fe-Mn family superoxide dismutase